MVFFKLMRWDIEETEGAECYGLEWRNLNEEIEMWNRRGSEENEEITEVFEDIGWEECLKCQMERIPGKEEVFHSEMKKTERGN